MSTNDNHHRNLEILRSSEYLPAHRMNVIKTGVMNIQPHARIEAEAVQTPITPAEQFDRQVAAQLRPDAAQPPMSDEVQAAVDNLDLSRKLSAVDAAYEGQVYPLPGDFEEYVKKAA